MAVVLDGRAEHLESIHPDRCVLHPLFALEDHVHRTSQQADKCVAFRRGEKNLGKLGPEDLHHDVEGGLQLSGRVPGGVLPLGGILSGLTAASGDGLGGGFLSGFSFDGGDGPL